MDKPNFNNLRSRNDFTDALLYLERLVTGAQQGSGGNGYVTTNSLANTLNNYVDKTSTQTDISGNKTFTGTTTLGNVTLSGHIIPDVNAIRDLGSSSIKFNVVWANNFLNNLNVTLGTGLTSSSILFRQGSGSQLVGGFQATTGNFFLQPAGTTPADAGYRLDVNGNTKITGLFSLLGSVQATGSLHTFGNGNAVSSAIITVDSTTKGFLQPRHTTSQKNEIVSPTAGLEVFDTDLQLPSFYNGTASAWRTVVDSESNQNITGQKVFNGNWTNGQIRIGGTTNQAGQITFARADGGMQGSIGYASPTTLSDFIINSNGGTGTIRFQTISGNALQIFNNTNIAINSAVDSGEKFQVNGTSKFTGQLKLTSTSEFVQYNTTDETTNYERVRGYWSGNNYFLGLEKGGTGSSARVFTLSSVNNRNFSINDGGNINGFFNFSTTSGAINVSVLGISGQTTASSGVNNIFSAITTINQSSTAGYRGIWVSPYEQSLGSGEKLLLDLGTNSAANGGGTHTSKFKVDNNGNTTIAGNWLGGQLNVGKIGQAGLVTFNRASDGIIVGSIGYTTATDSVDFAVRSFGSTSTLSLQAGSNQSFKIFSTGNTLIQTGGTFTDAGYKLDVAGITRLNGDVTVGGNILPDVNNTRNLGGASFRFAEVYTTNILASVLRMYSADLTINNAANSNVGKIFNSTGNWFIGSTPVDNSYKLEVNGTSRFNNSMIINGGGFPLKISSSESYSFFAMYNNVSSTQGVALGLDGTAMQLWNFQGGSMKFYVGTTGGSATERMRLENNGQFLISNNGLGATEASAHLELRSITRALLLTRQNSTERTAIASPVEGLILFNRTLKKLEFHNGTAWETVTSVLS